MIKKEIAVLLPGGLHVLNVTSLKKLVDTSESAVFIQAHNRLANCRDPISVLELCIRYNETVSILSDGIDEEQILEKIEKFLRNIE